MNSKCDERFDLVFVDSIYHSKMQITVAVIKSTFLAIGLLSTFALGNFAKCANTCPEEVDTICGVNKDGKYQDFPNQCIMDFHNCILPHDKHTPAPVPASFPSGKHYSCEDLNYQHKEL